MNGENVDRERTVYLTADGEDTVEELKEGWRYVIGGIVDRNRLKMATVKRAKELGVKTAKLDLGLGGGESVKGTKVLTVNHVFEILCRGRGGEGKNAVRESLPKRKGGDGEGGGGGGERGGGGKGGEKGGGGQEKAFAISEDKLEELVEGDLGSASCTATDRTIVDGSEVGYMYRAEPEFPDDCG